MSSRFAVAALFLASVATGCAPTERYYTNKNVEPHGPPPAADMAPCNVATPATRLQSRASNQRSVEGFGSFPCTTPAPPGRR